MDIEEKLYAEIKEYCKLNGLKVTKYVNELLREAFMRDKYGERPQIGNKKVEKNITNEEKEVKIYKIEEKPEKPIENKEKKCISDKDIKNINNEVSEKTPKSIKIKLNE